MKRKIISTITVGVNANGKFKANAALTTAWSKIEVTHAGTYIIDGVIY